MEDQIYQAAFMGAAATKFVDEAWDTGKKWISSRFRDHQDDARQQAEKNAREFLIGLGVRVDRLEKTSEECARRVDVCLAHPDFSVLYQNALLASAQTESKDKHELLGRLVADRLAYEPESLFAMTCHMACEAIPRLNARQMKILALITTVRFLKPPPSQLLAIAEARRKLEDWLPHEQFETYFRPYENLLFYPTDVLHLESLSCTRLSLGANVRLMDWVSTYQGGMARVQAASASGNLQEIVKHLWGSGLHFVTPTTTGQLIGAYVIDILTDTTTSLDQWEK